MTHVRYVLERFDKGQHVDGRVEQGGYWFEVERVFSIFSHFTIAYRVLGERLINIVTVLSPFCLSYFLKLGLLQACDVMPF